MGRGFLRRPTKQIKFGLKTKDIAVYQQRVQSYNGAMQSALHMINLYDHSDQPVASSSEGTNARATTVLSYCKATPPKKPSLEPCQISSLRLDASRVRSPRPPHCQMRRHHVMSVRRASGFRAACISLFARRNRFIRVPARLLGVGQRYGEGVCWGILSRKTVSDFMPRHPRMDPLGSLKILGT